MSKLYIIVIICNFNIVTYIPLDSTATTFRSLIESFFKKKKPKVSYELGIN